MTKRDFLRWLGSSFAVGLAPGLPGGPRILSSALAADPPDAAAAGGRSTPHVRIHEWGTFTSLQDMMGQSIGGINVDVEALPPFVYNDYRAKIRRANSIRAVFSKAGSDYLGPNRSVTMRLETPVLYVHGNADELQPWRLNVSVDFLGGRLSEFYPWAKVTANESGEKILQMSKNSRGTLEWLSLIMSKKADLPRTDLGVWLAPRNVDALDLTVSQKVQPNPDPDSPNNDKALLHETDPRSERYLFYRGVGSMQDILKTRMIYNPDAAKDVTESRLNDCTLSVSVAKSELTSAVLDQSANRTCKIAALWLVNVREDGSMAWKAVPGFSFGKKDVAPAIADEVKDTTVLSDRSTPFCQVTTRFADSDYAVERGDALRVDMRDALIRDGLNTDEADAMLATWDAAYFKSSGLRLFYITPKEWADVVLPLRISLVRDTDVLEGGAAKASSSRRISRVTDISRSMIARIELVTPEMKDKLNLVSKITETEVNDAAQLIHTAVTKDPSLRAAADSPAYHGPHPYRDIPGLPVPFVAYLDLGRFRDALLASIMNQNVNPNYSGAQLLYQLVNS